MSTETEHTKTEDEDPLAELADHRDELELLAEEDVPLSEDAQLFLDALDAGPREDQS